MELKLTGVSWAQREKDILSDVSVTVPATGLTCLLGNNGAVRQHFYVYSQEN